MKKITIYNIEKNEVVATFETNKRNYHSITGVVIDKIKELNKGYCVFIQGVMKTLDSGLNNCLLGNNLHWVSKNGQYQFTIE